MTKTKFSKSIILCSMSFFFIISNTSCDTESLENSTETTNEEKISQENDHKHVESKTMSIDEIPFVQNYLSSKIGFDINNKSNNMGNAIFDTEEIVQTIDSSGNMNYSINFLLKNSNRNVFYNLYFGLDSKGNESEPMIIKYTLNPDRVEQFFMNGSNFLDFSGNISLHKYTDFFEEDIFGKSDNCPVEHDEYGDPIPCVEENIDNGDSGGSSTGIGGTGQSSGSGSSGGSGSLAVSLTCDCVGHSSIEIAAGVCDCDSFSLVVFDMYQSVFSSNSINKPSSKDSNDDCPGCDNGASGTVGLNLSTNVSQLKLILSLNDNQALFFQQDSEFAQGALDYLEYLNYSSESKDLIKTGIDELMSFDSSNYPGKEIGYQYNWWFNENFIVDSMNFDIPADNPAAPEEKPNNLEVFLFALFPTEAILHIQNAKTALPEAQDLVSNGTLTGIEDGKADAFRHAFWNALDNAEFSRAVTNAFTDAHEAYSSGLPKAMDLYNNDRGMDIGENFNIYSSDSQISAAVLQAVYDGTLRYIFNSTLIPTNQ